MLFSRFKVYFLLYKYKYKNTRTHIYKYIYIFVVLGFELRVYTLSHSTSPFFVCDGFFSR
jgi:hypothetical protein